MEAVAEPGNLAGVRHIILVLSGKGGVGKSTISTELALALRHAGKKVGILDVDLCGPSVPRMLQAQGCAVHQCDNGWVPVFVDQEQSIALMSVGFLLETPDEAVVWRGPKKNGTSDEHISAVEALRPYQPLGAVLVTTPQAVSVGDVRRELTFCRKTGLPVIGIVENMSGFVCPHCAVRRPAVRWAGCRGTRGLHSWPHPSVQECTNLFSVGGGEELARHAGVPFLGECQVGGSGVPVNCGSMPAGTPRCRGQDRHSLPRLNRRAALWMNTEAGVHALGSTEPAHGRYSIRVEVSPRRVPAWGICSLKEALASRVGVHGGDPSLPRPCPPFPRLLIFTGSVPLDPQLVRSLEEGRDFIQEFPKSAAFPALASIAQKILDGAQVQAQTGTD
ncbi:cytosolic Fe-S cluster assembly factor NUBP2 isoform X2 [Loxodonta africana]|uniref:cytosolic Fe-S cluster assembly factor NUBP2 isoform X2 n=1 Tax=Loxodonta africana TaxID=9785 RepID=UPI0030CBC296